MDVQVRRNCGEVGERPGPKLLAIQIRPNIPDLVDNSAQCAVIERSAHDADIVEACQFPQFFFWLLSCLEFFAAGFLYPSQDLLDQYLCRRVSLRLQCHNRHPPNYQHPVYGDSCPRCKYLERPQGVVLALTI